MSDAFTPQVRTLLDRFEPPALSADFTDRVLAQAEATLALPPLPPLPTLRQPRWRGGRRVALAVGIAGLVSVAAAAAVVPAQVWRQLPVIGGIVEMIAPVRTEQPPAPVPAQPEAAPVVSEVADAPVPEDTPPDELTRGPVAESEVVAPPAAPAPAPSPRAEASAPAGSSPSIERNREAPPRPERVIPTAERPTLAETRAVAPTVPERVPERVSPADTRETRQQTRERATETRQATRERIERRERRANRTN